MKLGRIVPNIAPAWIILFLLIPILSIFAQGLSVESLRWAAGDYVQTILGRSILQSAASTVLATILALTAYWVSLRIPARKRSLFMAVNAIPFVLPVVVVVTGIQSIFGPNGWGVVEISNPFWLIVVSHAYYEYGFVLLLFSQAFQARDRVGEQMARAHGAPKWNAFYHASWPRMRVSVLGAIGLSVLFTITSFGVVKILGGRSDGTIETLIYDQIRGAFPRYEYAATLAILQFLITLLALAALARKPSKVERPSSQPKLRKSSRFAWFWLALPIIPMVATFVQSVQNRGEWTLEAWRAILSGNSGSFALLPALQNSLLYAILASGIGTLLALLAGYKLRNGNSRVASIILMTPFAVGSVVLGLACTFSFGASGIDLRGRTALIVLGHTLVAFPFLTRILAPRIALLPKTHDQMAQALGLPTHRVWSELHLAQLWPTIRRCLGLGAVISFGDYGASLILSQKSQYGLGLWVEAIRAPYRTDLFAQSAVIATLLTLLVLVTLVSSQSKDS